MRKSLIVASESTNLYTTERFLSEANKLKWNAQYLNPYQSSINYQSNAPKAKDGIYLLRTTGIKFDDFDLYKAREYELNNFKIVNHHHSLSEFRCKERQIFFLKKNSLPHIPTITFRGEMNEDLIQTIFKLNPKQEYIVKMSRGNGGIGVQLLRGADSILSVLETFKALNDQKLLIQPYIEHQTEYRVFASKNKIYSIIEKKISKNDFRGNSKRSKGKLVKKLPQELQAMTESILLKSDLEYMGIDLMYANHRPYILEVNGVPGFKQIEELSKINVARELLLEFNYNK